MTNETRINIIIGQLEGIKKMLASSDSNGCTDLIIQLKAVKSALSSLLEKIVSEEMGRCLIGQKKDHQDKMLKMLKELINK